MFRNWQQSLETGNVCSLTQREFWICQGKPHYTQVRNDNTSNVARISFGVFNRINYVENFLTASKFLVAEMNLQIFFSFFFNLFMNFGITYMLTTSNLISLSSQILLDMMKLKYFECKKNSVVMKTFNFLPCLLRRTLSG